MCHNNENSNNSSNNNNNNNNSNNNNENNNENNNTNFVSDEKGIEKESGREQQQQQQQQEQEEEQQPQRQEQKEEEQEPILIEWVRVLGIGEGTTTRDSAIEAPPPRKFIRKLTTSRATTASKATLTTKSTTTTTTKAITTKATGTKGKGKTAKMGGGKNADSDADDWRKKLKKAKKEHRPSLKDWECDGMSYKFPPWCHAIMHAPATEQYKSFLVNDHDDNDDTTDADNAEPQLWSAFRRNIPVVLDAKTLTPSQFHSEYEAKEVPCLIRNIPQGYDGGQVSKRWTAVDHWSFPALLGQQQPQQHNGSSSNNNNGANNNNNTLRNGNHQNADSHLHHHHHPYKKHHDSSMTMSSTTAPSSTASVSSTRSSSSTNSTNSSEQQQNYNPLLDRRFKCGEDDEGYAIKVKLRHFLSYLQHNQDDSPLYIFDSHFDGDKVAKSILADYTVPSYFKDDLFNLVSESRRPPYRWWLVGPARSGTTVHIDPLATSAWNTLLVGQKRWVLFPPHVPKHIVKGRNLVADDEDDEAIHYFMYILPRIKAKAASVYASSSTKTTKTTTMRNNNHNYNNNTHHHNEKKRMKKLKELQEYRDFACYEFTQHASETVFVPTGWWHAVLNLTDTIGCTQNYVSERNFEKCWLQTRTGRKRMAYKWLVQLQSLPQYAHLAKKARQLNERDSFVMKYDPENNNNNNKGNSNNKEAGTAKLEA